MPTEPPSWDDRYDTITSRAWSDWTSNGAGMDAETRLDSTGDVRYAAGNAWCIGKDDAEWLSATLALLGRYEPSSP